MSEEQNENQYTELCLRQEVQRGAALLDEKRPGWEFLVNTKTLMIQSPGECVLAQVYGDYIQGLVKAGVGVEGDDHVIRGRAGSSAHGPHGFAGYHLEPIWKDEIFQRRNQKTQFHAYLISQSHEDRGPLLNWLRAERELTAKAQQDKEHVTMAHRAALIGTINGE